MKLTILMDNNTYIDQYYLGEPAFSVYIEDGAEKILFDTGYSDAFLRNAEQMQIDMNALTYIVLSHGHNDHSRGLTFLWDNGQRVPYMLCICTRTCSWRKRR